MNIDFLVSGVVLVIEEKVLVSLTLKLFRERLFVSYLQLFYKFDIFLIVIMFIFLTPVNPCGSSFGLVWLMVLATEPRAHIKAPYH